jgi:DNA polymerase-3 subunit gamma/tau
VSYLVLARKYRPAAFADVVGQDHVTRTLGNAFASGRVHHAFLFCGPRGVGKTTLARILGKALNCEQGATATPCGTCVPCATIANGSATDYIEMDGASNRGIDAIRELTESVRYQPASLRKKVYVIDEVHMLTTEAFNALLKTLEEPPPHVTFVLATTEPHKLPNTILSRCQRYDVKLVPASRLAQHLAKIFAAEKLAIEPAAIALIVRESGGSVRDALSLCDQLISFVGNATIAETHVAEVLGVADRALTRSLVGALVAGDAGAALGAVDAAAERGVDEVQIARAVVRYLRDLAVAQAAPGRPELIDATDEERAELAVEAGGVDASRVRQMLERMLKACDELGKTLQPRLALDFALIDVATIEPLVPLGDLIERLGEMEARIATGGGGSGGVARQAPAARPQPAPAPALVSKAAPPPPPAPAPAPTPTPAPAPPAPPKAEPQSMVAAWEHVLTALQQQHKMSLFMLYEHARIVAWTADAIELAFRAEDQSLGEMAREKPKLDEMRSFLREHLGRPVNIAVRLLDATESATAPARSVLEIDRQRSADERKKRETEAREHPMTKIVLQTFGAQIKEIKTDV